MRGVASLGGITFDVVQDPRGGHAERILGGNAVYGAWGPSLVGRGRRQSPRRLCRRRLPDGLAPSARRRRDHGRPASRSSTASRPRCGERSIATLTIGSTRGRRRTRPLVPNAPPAWAWFRSPRPRAAAGPWPRRPGRHRRPSIARPSKHRSSSTIWRPCGDQPVTVLVDPGEESVGWTDDVRAEVLSRADVYCPSLDDLETADRTDPGEAAASLAERRSADRGGEARIARIGRLPHRGGPSSYRRRPPMSSIRPAPATATAAPSPPPYSALVTPSSPPFWLPQRRRRRGAQRAPRLPRSRHPKRP